MREEFESKIFQKDSSINNINKKKSKKKILIFIYHTKFNSNDYTNIIEL